MTPLTLTLKGFRGIRDGLGRDEITLNLADLVGDAQVIAIAGPNGRGKTTLLDNLHPYRLMPSRSATYSPGGFSYYDQLCAPEAKKDLTWAHAGRSFRTQLVFRANGATRRTEAFLHEQCDGNWIPVTLGDGTRSDGKTDTYDRCVNDLLGPPEIFFTSQFSAQKRKALSEYTPGQVKGLMVELLGLDQVKATGERAAKVASLLMVGLEASQRRLAEGERQRGALKAVETQHLSATARIKAAADAKDVAGRHARARAEELAKATAVQQSMAEELRKRAALTQRRAAHLEAIAQHRKEREARERLLASQLASLDEAATRSLAQSHEQARKREAEIATAEAVLGKRATIDAALQQQASVQAAEARARQELDRAKAAAQRADTLDKTIRDLEVRIAMVERDAGAATIRVADLKKKFGLTELVPCRGTDLQQRCSLLNDAHKAAPLIPSADQDITRYATERATLQGQLTPLLTEAKALGNTKPAVAACEQALALSVQAARQNDSLVALAPSLQDAIERVARARAEIAEILEARAQATAADTKQRDTLRADWQAFLHTHAERAAALDATLRSLDEDIARLAALPGPDFLAQADAASKQAETALAGAERAHVEAIEHAAKLAGQLEELKRAVEAIDRMLPNVRRLEDEIGLWRILAKAFNNDGVIALCIDDAGPALAALTNDLLVSCYGSRFTVAIATQIETARKDLKEGFDVIVYDSQSGEKKSLSNMSGGEQVWINECLTRAIALYLSQSSGRRYDTLFSDETDGPLDEDRKRMFMEMKRKVIELGGYKREVFITQTRELWNLADTVIDIDHVEAAPAQ